MFFKTFVLASIAILSFSVAFIARYLVKNSGNRKAPDSENP
jgi:hypothetical protein